MPIWIDGPVLEQEGKKHPFRVKPIMWGVLIDKGVEYTAGILPQVDLTRREDPNTPILVVGMRGADTHAAFQPLPGIGALPSRIRQHLGDRATLLTSAATQWYLGLLPKCPTPGEAERLYLGKTKDRLDRQVREPITATASA